MSPPDGSAPVKPIKFKPLPEDSGQAAPQDEPPPADRKQTQTSFTSRASPAQGSPNFTLEYSYPAVIFDNICFRVDRSSQQANFLEECIFRSKHCLGSSQPRTVDILKSVNLSVPYGSIFGLLGPSSCGKTTLLRCLVGLLEPTSGSIRLFGHHMGARPDSHEQAGRSSARSCLKNLLGMAGAGLEARTNRAKVPGANVGYMPQDLGLYEDFTIREILEMFGRYMRMSNKLTATRIEFMSQFLELPDIDRQIQSLSGGQKRRVSFAIACLHMPPLIILDEPTVGVDPLLRQSIWKYLRRLADHENRTIIITTHYIEEAAQADQVAFMRAGEILVQDTPSRIMKLNRCKTLEESFLKICNNYELSNEDQHTVLSNPARSKLYPQPKLNLTNELGLDPIVLQDIRSNLRPLRPNIVTIDQREMDAKEKMELFDNLRSCRNTSPTRYHASLDDPRLAPPTKTSISRRHKTSIETIYDGDGLFDEQVSYGGKQRKSKLFKTSKFTLNDPTTSNYEQQQERFGISAVDDVEQAADSSLLKRLGKSLTIIGALIYKNYRRNFNSIPLVAFQFLLPIIQMISFSLCVGGRPTNIGLGLVNMDQLTSYATAAPLFLNPSNGTMTTIPSTTIDVGYYEDTAGTDELLSLRYLSHLDRSMLDVKPYDNLKDAIGDVRRAKLWAVMEIGANFTESLLRRFDSDSFYQLDLDTIHQSVIKIYPDKSNKILHMICHRSLVDSYRRFLAEQFDQFKHLPIEMKEPIFDIEPNIISNSIDGYTESIAPGLLASLTYIMAAGLTTFIMVVERGAGILERTYTTGINPVAYLLAHAIFRSLLMMLQIALVLVLTFYVLRQPLVGSIWIAYLMLMTLNVTGIAYGLLISSIVADQNGAALTIVSSLVIKITLSGILWPLEAIPVWLRTICYIQPLTMPVQALKSIILKGSTLGDRAVNLGFLVSISWLIVFIIISAKRFKFYQH